MSQCGECPSVTVVIYSFNKGRSLIQIVRHTTEIELLSPKDCKNVKFEGGSLKSHLTLWYGVVCLLLVWYLPHEYGSPPNVCKTGTHVIISESGQHGTGLQGSSSHSCMTPALDIETYI